ncbi:MAG: class I SAM-dependent methyltransferase [Bryobacterales bacterium]
MQKEKTFEHFVAMRLLRLTERDVFVDLASEGSPLPEIAARLSGCRALAQDIMYPAGIRDGKMGGDACAMPVEDGFASAAALTCSLEHFESDADTRLFHELARVLRPGGRVVVVPLYVFREAAAQTDPRYSVSVDVEFDEGVPLYCAEGWGNRHGRFYSPETLVERTPFA